MNIVISYDQPLSNLPAGFTSVVSAVAAFYSSQFSDNITFSLHVGYGEVHGGALDAGALGESSYFLNTYSYTQIRNSLVADARTGDDTTALGNVPVVDPITGTHQYWLAQVDAKALGLLSNATTVNTYVGFSSTATFDYDNSNGVAAGQFDFYGIVAHELAEVMGKNILVGQSIGSTPNSYVVSDLFHYASPGVRDFSGTTPGYFSIDGGLTNLNNFNTNSGGDFGDWASSVGSDSWRAFSNSGVINSISESDLKFLDVIGFDRAVAAVPGSISINDIVVSEGDSGTKTATFTVTRTGGIAAFDVNFATTDGSATIPDNDYVAASGTLHFGSNVNSQTISVTISGDTKIEPDEAFFVNLSGATNGATISDSTGICTITNDDTAPGITPPPASTPPVIVATVDVDHFGNFNGDSADDFLWRNSDGTVSTWLMSASGPAGFNVGSVSTDWHIEGTGDFNGDHRSDVLWRNDNGLIGEWQMKGASATAVNVGLVTSDWHVGGIGDFNGDGHSDILWRNDNGLIGEWQMNGASVTPINLQPVGLGWHLVGMGDFNADGRDDILWRSDSGMVGAWLLNGAAMTPINLGMVTNDWHILGTGDFNGDGRTDILWRNDSGWVGEWLINAGGSVTASNIIMVSADWHVAATGDVNGDTFDDIIWRNDNGAVGEWLMHGSTVTPQDLPPLDTAWMISGHHFDLI